MAYYHDIAADIRTQISHGKYEKNQKLPKQTELAITYKTSRVTIQKALNLLQVEGIIYAKKRHWHILSVKPILPSIITPE